ncbi:hypothetical protein UFOVP296_7 [uncultured Caudovirales phage]|uniref:Uncharacterized protein n=1 Tax=uncultured Caudovirales phage TaxID=2100421 RepID=A0A6J5LSP1_9CAUD|nr:hypothetical protein UFOVP296_7 [uncultured Caudovirales phage]CAB4169996.1 hypothetical protein UFOVP912_26 [uncultured Caudovirales phage]CAB4199099.1 hypothetical protein UFOVP1334_14 [uncultured Caudovirales phage]
MATVAGVKTPWAFVRLWAGEPPAWAADAKYIRVMGTKGAPYTRHLLDLFRSQRNAWMIGGQGALEAIATDGAGEDVNIEQFFSMNPTYV